MNNLNMRMSGSDSKLEHLLSDWLFGQSANNAIRIMLEANNIVDFEGFCLYDRDGLLSLTRMKDLMPISLTKPEVEMILDITHYSDFMLYKGRDISDDPENWVKDDFDDWIDNGRHPTVASANASSSGTTDASVVSSEDHSSSNSTKDVAAAVVVDDDNINNAKSPPECENLIGDLDGVNDKYYQANGKYYSTGDLDSMKLIILETHLARQANPNLNVVDIDAEFLSIIDAEFLLIDAEFLSTEEVVTSPEIVSDEEVILNEIFMKIVSTKEIISNFNSLSTEEIISILNTAAAMRVDAARNYLVMS